MATEYKGYNISLERDDFNESPLEWGSCGFFSTNKKMSSVSFGDFDKSTDDFDSLDEIEAYFEANGYVYKKMYLYDHSGWTVSSKPFGCRWDSGVAGYLYIDKKSAVRDFGGNKRLTKPLREKTELFLEGMIESLDQYFTGDVWCISIEDPSGEEIESCGGFYGEDAAIDEAKALIDADIAYQEKKAIADAAKTVFANSFFRLEGGVR